MDNYYKISIHFFKFQSARKVMILYNGGMFKVSMINIFWINWTVLLSTVLQNYEQRCIEIWRLKYQN